MVFLMFQISQQLSSASNASSLPDPSPAGTFQPPPSAIRINSLWFSSLVLSLISASIGLLVKQWLREYNTIVGLSPRPHFRLHFARHEGLVKWRVFEIAAFLPLLVQASLVLFLIGLTEYVRTLNAFVGWLVSGIIIAWLTIYVLSNVLPLLYSSCPYRSCGVRPAYATWKRTGQLRLHHLPSFLRKCCLVVARRISRIPRFANRVAIKFRRVGLKFLQREPSLTDNPHLPYPVTSTFAGVNKDDEETACAEAQRDALMLAELDALFVDDGLLGQITSCLQDVPLDGTLQCTSQLAIHPVVASRKDHMSLSQTPWDAYRFLTETRVTCIYRALKGSLISEIDKINPSALLDPLRSQDEAPSQWTPDMTRALRWLLEWSDLSEYSPQSFVGLYPTLLGRELTIASGAAETLAHNRFIATVLDTLPQITNPDGKSLSICQVVSSLNEI